MSLVQKDAGKGGSCERSEAEEKLEGIGNTRKNSYRGNIRSHMKAVEPRKKRPRLGQKIRHVCHRESSPGQLKRRGGKSERGEKLQEKKKSEVQNRKKKGRRSVG